MIHSNHETSSRSVKQFRERYQQLFVAQLGEGVFLLKNNGLALTLARRLQKTYGGMVDVYLVERLTEAYVPEKVKRVAEYLEDHERGVSLETAIRKSGYTEDEIEWQKVESRIALREK